jgi:hypothetical protein
MTVTTAVESELPDFMEESSKVSSESELLSNLFDRWEETCVALVTARNGHLGGIRLLAFVFLTGATCMAAPTATRAAIQTIEITATIDFAGCPAVSRPARLRPLRSNLT